MGNCLEKSEAFLRDKEPILGEEDFEKDGAYEIKIKLVSEKVVHCWVLPSDTMRTIDGKVRSIYSIPRIFRAGTYEKPEMQAFLNKRLASVPWDVTIEELDVKHLMYELNTTEKIVDNDTERYYHTRERILKYEKNDEEYILNDSPNWKSKRMVTSSAVLGGSSC